MKRVTTRVVIDIATGRVEERDFYAYAGPWALATNIFALTQGAFRFYEDGAEDTSTPSGAQSANITRYAAANTSFQLRVRMDETGAGSIAGATTDDYQLQVSKNGGAFANVTAASSNVRGFNSASLTDGNATTQRLTGGAGTFAGKISEDGLVDNHQIAANGNAEFLYSLEIVAADVADADTLDFRVLLNGATTNVTYSVTPRVTVSKVSPAPSQSAGVVPAKRLAFSAAILAAATVGNLLTSTLAPEPVVDPVYTATQTTLIVGKGSAPRFNVVNLLGTTLAESQGPAQDPFTPVAWRNPLPPRGQILVSINTVTGEYPEPPAPPSDPPFSQQRWPNPALRPGRILVSINTVTSDYPAPPPPASGDPFVQSNWPNPKVRPRPALTWLQGDIIHQLIPYRATDTGDPATVLPPRAVRRLLKTVAPNLLATTLSGPVVNPEQRNHHWPNPRLKSAPARTWTQSLQQGTLNPATQPDPIRPINWPNPTRRGASPRTDALNLLESTLAPAAPVQDPFRQTNWRNPQRRAVATPVDRLQNLTISLPVAPVVNPEIRNADWPVPQRKRGAALSWTYPRPLVLPVPPVVNPEIRNHHWPVPLRKRVTALSWIHSRVAYYPDTPVSLAPDLSTVTLLVETQFVSGTWTAITDDIVEPVGLRLSYGVDGNGPTDCVASTGECGFALRNDADNSGGTLGWYSPVHVSKRTGWTFGIPLRVSFYGVGMNVISLSRSGSVATVNTSGVHGRVTGEYVYIGGADQSEYNGVFQVTVTGSATFTYEVSGSPATPATGTIASHPAYVKFRGKIREIVPDAGLYRERRVYVTAYDGIRDLVEADTRDVSLQVEKTESELITAVLDALESESQPIDRDIDSGIDTYPYAFDKVGSGTRALAVLKDVVQSAYGLAFVKGDGTFVYRNRHNRAAGTSNYTFTNAMRELVVPSSLDKVFNRVRVTIHPKTISATATDELYSLPTDTSIEIPTGQTREVWTEYTDPTDRHTYIGGADVVTTLVGGTHYSANTAADGSGSDVTGSMTATLSAFASTGKWSLTNTSAATAYIRTLKVIGKAVRDPGQQTLEAFTSQPYGDRPVDIDMPYQDDSEIGRNAALWIQAQYRSLEQQIETMGYTANVAQALLEQALEREPGDLVTVTETVTGIATVAVVIHSVRIEVKNKTLIDVRWGLAPAAPFRVWQLGVAGSSELGETTTLGF